MRHVPSGLPRGWTRLPHVRDTSQPLNVQRERARLYFMAHKNRLGLPSRRDWRCADCGCAFYDESGWRRLPGACFDLHHPDLLNEPLRVEILCHADHLARHGQRVRAHDVGGEPVTRIDRPRKARGIPAHRPSA